MSLTSFVRIHQRLTDDNGWGRRKRPVINIDGDEAASYCQWLSEKSNQLYRLPTEEKWVYACKAQTLTKYSFGNDEKKLNEYAWYIENSQGCTHPVGEKKPNKFGIFDMHGNVWEWCKDWHNNYQVNRGGAWYNDSSNLAINISNKLYTNDLTSGIGFSVVLA